MTCNGWRRIMTHGSADRGTVLIDTEAVKGVAIVEGDHLELVEIKLSESGTVAPHVLPIEVLFYVIKGTCRIRIGEKSLDAPAGTAVVSPAGIEKSIECLGGEPAVILACKRLT